MFQTGYGEDWLFLVHLFYLDKSSFLGVGLEFAGSFETIKKLYLRWFNPFHSQIVKFICILPPEWRNPSGRVKYSVCMQFFYTNGWKLSPKWRKRQNNMNLISLIFCLQVYILFGTACLGVWEQDRIGYRKKLFHLN